jgi:hypothetical protein
MLKFYSDPNSWAIRIDNVGIFKYLKAILNFEIFTIVTIIFVVIH